MSLVGKFKDEAFAYACAAQQGVKVGTTNINYKDITKVGFYMAEDNNIVPVLEVVEQGAPKSAIANRFSARHDERKHACTVDLKKHVASVPVLDVLNHFGDSYEVIMEKIEEVTQSNPNDPAAAFKEYVDKKTNPQNVPVLAQ